MEKFQDDQYQIAAIDKSRIFKAQNPGELATVYSCSASNPTVAQDAQIFYALAPQIQANNYFTDLLDQHCSVQLNNWSIQVNDTKSTNLFSMLQIMNLEQRMQLYSTNHSITPADNGDVRADGISIFVVMSQKLNWKTGIVQRCIDRLVKLEHRNNPQVYATMDIKYRYIMRCKLENEHTAPQDPRILSILAKLYALTHMLGLKNSQDTSLFTLISEARGIINELCKDFRINTTGSDINKLTAITHAWHGGKVAWIGDKYQIVMDPLVLAGLGYTQPWLFCPERLDILDTTF